MDHLLALADVVEAAENFVKDTGSQAQIERALDILNDTPLVE